MKGLQAMIYRAFRWAPDGSRWLSAVEVDEHELWQLGVMLDGDTGVMLTPPIRPADAPVEPVEYRPPELLEVD